MSLSKLLSPLAEGAAAHKTELAGLGVLAVPSVDEAQAHVRARLAGDYNAEGVKKRTILPHATKPASELAGLGILAAPAVGGLLSKHAFDAFFNELVKLGAVSDEQARRSLDRLDQLDKNKPTMGQVGRYGALGAGAGALGHVVSRAIEGGARTVTKRSALGAAAAGAIGMGAVPLVRGALDRHAEKKTLKSYLRQPE